MVSPLRGQGRSGAMECCQKGEARQRWKPRIYLRAENGFLASENQSELKGEGLFIVSDKRLQATKIFRREKAPLIP
jgi:hypothetical protein